MEYRAFLNKFRFKPSMVVTAGERRKYDHNALVSLAQACHCGQTET